MVAAGALAASGAAVGLLAGSAGAGPGAPVVPVTITKTVLGTDPGVAFPITLNCFSEGVGDGSVETTDITIPNDGNVSETVNLRNGESATIQVTLPPDPPEHRLVLGDGGSRRCGCALELHVHGLGAPRVGRPLRRR